tara:strand:+ start:38234 stop:41017 length:2784 start_codon:yes stop_codon:yes gene_type:complete
MVLGYLPAMAGSMPGLSKSQRAELVRKATSELSAAELKQYASATMDSSEIADLQVITDNDIAFWKKVEVIRSAQRGDELRLVYFIFANDTTSSFLAKELLDAAKRGVRVKLMVDYFQNYAKIDLLKAMELNSKGLIQVRLYNRPTRNTILDAAYLTLGCDGELTSNADRTACKKIKIQKLDAAVAEANEPMLDKAINISNMNIAQSGLFLSGLYSKDSDIMAKAVLGGQQIDLSKLKSGDSDEPAMTAEDKEGLKTFLKLIWKAKTADNPFTRLSAAMQLRLAFLLFGESKKLNQIYNGLTGVVPFSTSGSKAYGDRLTKDFVTVDRSHLTDYTHHKLVMKNGSKWVMGGRNVEDSYHVASEDLISKYMFMDTDVMVTLKQDSQAMRDSYDKIFNFRAMAASLNEVAQHAPNDQAANLAIVKNKCLEGFLSDVKGLATSEQRTDYLRSADYRSEKRTPEFKEAKAAYQAEACTQLQADYTADERREMAMGDLLALAQEYEAYAQEKGLLQKVSENKSTLKLSANDKKTAKIAYLENIHFDKDMEDTSQARRVYGLTEYTKPNTDGSQSNIFVRAISAPFKWLFAIDNEKSTSTRYIHDALVRGMESACARSRDGKEREQVILHNAYFAPPSNLLSSFANMLDGTWDCRNVDLVIITNSFDTTDLTPVNLVARHAFLPLIQYNNRINAGKKRARAATLSYFEYENDENFFKRSLHSKVTVLGKNDIIIGSANADYRSYLMDTNNALYIKDAPELVAEYTSGLKKLIASADTKSRSTSEFEPKLMVPKFVEQSRNQIVANDWEIVQAEMAKYGVEKYLENQANESSEGEQSYGELILYFKSLLDLAYNKSHKVVSVLEDEDDIETMIEDKMYRVIKSDNNNWYDMSFKDQFRTIKDSGSVLEIKPTPMIKRLRKRFRAGEEVDDAWKSI